MGMAEETASRGNSPAPEKSRAHGIQNAWLNKAKGRTIRAKLVDGEILEGKLMGDDVYCIAVQIHSEDDPRLIYKHSISYLSCNQE
jgi:sRNA-binding regulator protein Hfq